MKQLHMHMREQNWWRQLQFQWRKEKSSSWNKYPSENSRGESRKRSRRRPILGPDHDLVARLSENGHPLTRELEDSRAENQPAHTASEQEKPDQAGAVNGKQVTPFTPSEESVAKSISWPDALAADWTKDVHEEIYQKRCQLRDKSRGNQERASDPKPKSKSKRGKTIAHTRCKNRFFH
jgi:hypothetical protein